MNESSSKASQKNHCSTSLQVRKPILTNFRPEIKAPIKLKWKGPQLQVSLSKKTRNMQLTTNICSCQISGFSKVDQK